MTTDILIQALREAFERTVHAAVDARMSGILQQHANVTGQLAADIAALSTNREDDRQRFSYLTLDVDNLKQRVAALELRMPLNTDLNKIRELIDNKIEEVMARHLNTYNHDEYDRIVAEVDDFDLDSIVTDDDLESRVGDALRSASFSVEMSL